MKIKELPEGHRYVPGFASLAKEVLKDAVVCGTNPETLQGTLWAEYLALHVSRMRQGRTFHAQRKIERETEVSYVED